MNQYSIEFGEGKGGEILCEGGMRLYPGFLEPEQQARLVDDIRQVIRMAPLFRPTMPRTGKPLSVRMTSAGRFGWLSDDAGYRYGERHPVTGSPWPRIPESILDIWEQVAGVGYPAECCLINWYAPEAKMGLHRDRDEEAKDAPVVSISLGDTGVFRLGGPERRGRTRSYRLNSGDVLVLDGESRHWHHGIDRILAASPKAGTVSSGVLGAPGRINVTLRRVTQP